MTRAVVKQTSFTSGELDPRLLGRSDLRAYENGAARLRNMLVETTGGVRRRPGTRYLTTAPGAGRLATLEVGAETAYVLIFTDLQVDIVRDGVVRARLLTPWTSAEVPGLVWAQYDASLIVTHPDAPPQQLRRVSDTVWTLDEFTFAEKADQITCAPFARFAAPDVAIQSSAAAGTVTLTTSAPVFVTGHLGSVFRIRDVQIEITNVQSATEAVGQVLPGQDPVDTTATTDWDELAFSAAHGWARTVSFHQDRMVFGGSRDLPDAIWFSKTGRPRDFDFGTGLDDEAIAFRLASNEVQEIRALISGRHLQIFTSAGEWIVTGDPLTPTRIQVVQQSRVGSPGDRYVPPVDVDGATLFAARNGREIREYLFSDTEQAYETADLALLARHLVVDPVDQAFDHTRRTVWIAMRDGSLATLNVYRQADIAAWSLQETSGRVLSVATLDGAVFVLVERESGVLLEQFDEDLFIDAGVSVSVGTPNTNFAGLDHLEGQVVAVVADDLVLEPQTVAGGQVTLPTPARQVAIGLPYVHTIEPLPVRSISDRIGLDPAYRPIRIAFRLFETRALRVDTGDGLRNVPLHTVGGGPLDRTPALVSRDVAVSAFGWRRGGSEPPWRIVQDEPLPSHILSATTEVEVND